MLTRTLIGAAACCAVIGVDRARAELVVGPTIEVDYVGPDGTFIHYHPDAVWNVGGFQLAWSDNFPGCVTSCEYDIRAATVTPAGGVSVPLQVFGRVGEDGSVALAARDGKLCAAWKGAGEGIYVGVGSGALGPLVAARAVTSFGGSPAVADGPEGWLLVWIDDLALRALHLDASGAAIEGTPITLADLVDVNQRPRVTHDDQSFVVVWADGPIEVGVLARRVPDSGTTLGPAVEVSVDDGDAPDIAWDGEQLGVTFVHGGVQLFLLDGALAARPDRSVTIRGGAGMSPAIAPREGGGFLVVYAEDRPPSERWGDIGLYAMRVAPDGTLLDSGTPGVLGSGSALVVNDAGWLEWHPRLARGEGGQYLVVWEGSVDRTPTVSTTGIFAVLIEDRPDGGASEPEVEVAESAEAQERPPRDEGGCAGGDVHALAGLVFVAGTLIRCRRNVVRR